VHSVSWLVPGIAMQFSAGPLLWEAKDDTPTEAEVSLNCGGRCFFENVVLMLNGHDHKICSVCAVKFYLHNVASFYAFVEEFEIFLRQRRSIWHLATDEVQSSVLFTLALSLSVAHSTHARTQTQNKFSPTWVDFQQQAYLGQLHLGRGMGVAKSVMGSRS